MALNLFGVAFHESHEGHLPVPDTSLVVVRDLAAICGESGYAKVQPSDEKVARHADVVGAFAARSAVLPAPFGVVFKGRDSVERWLELHYLALTAALNFVDNRVAARVHVHQAGTTDQRDAGGTSDLAAVAAESLRALRRASVGTVPLRADIASGIVLSAAFLVEEELWREFAAQVEAEAGKSPNLRFELTGPWPPYDFVQMQLGS